MRVFVLVTLFSLLFVSVAFASVDPGEDPGGFISELVGAAQGGEWPVFAGLAIIGLTYVARLANKREWLPINSDRGGTIFVMLASFAASTGNALVNEHSIASLKLLYDAFVTSVVAIGGYTELRQLIWPEDEGKR